MGEPGAAAACSQAAGSTVEMDQTAAHRRDPPAGADRRSRGGTCPSATAPDRRSTGFSPLATQWNLARILAALQTRADAAGLITWEANVDSTIMRAHQHAAGARRHGDSQREPPSKAGAADVVLAHLGDLIRRLSAQTGVTHHSAAPKRLLRGRRQPSAAGSLFPRQEGPSRCGHRRAYSPVRRRRRHPRPQPRLGDPRLHR